MDTTYIHYGSNHYDPRLFMPIRNGLGMPKPEGGTGLWASRVGDEWGWESWCRENEYGIDALRRHFRFTLPGANILTLESLEQLASLPKADPYGQLFAEIGHPERKPNDSWCYLDYEKLAQSYDAIEIEDFSIFRTALYTWDCNCILVMNGTKVVELT